MIMKHSKFIYIGIALMTVTACSTGGADEPSGSGYIRLCAAVGDIEISSRTVADAYLGSMPSTKKPLDSSVWFRTENGVYENAPSATTSLPVHTGVTFSGPQLEYVRYDSKNLQYPTDNSKVYCIGLCPNDGDWTPGVGDMSVSHPIDGHDDVMFAGENAGTWNNHFKPLQYEHLLTWIKIAVCATSHDTAEAWGRIEQISINSKPGVNIDLTNGIRTTYEGEDRFINTMAAGEPVQLLTTMHEVGSVLCSPETEYTLRVKTENNTEAKEVTLKLNLMDAGGDNLTPIGDKSQARGKCFVLSLYFRPYDVVEGVCILNSWNSQSEDIYLTAE